MAYRDWNTLYNEAIKDGMKNIGNITTYIQDNTDDPKSSVNGKVPAEYSKSLKEWVKEKMEKSKPVKESISFLIESELEKATLVLAAKAIPDKLQDMAEKLANIEPDDIMPLLEQLKVAYGPQAAEQFSQAVTSKVRELLDEVKSAKDAIDTQISNLEGVANGGSMPTDMDGAMGDDEGDMDTGMGMGTGDAPPPPGVGANASGDAPPPPGVGDEENEFDGNPAGRARKESRTFYGNSLSEAKKKKNWDLYHEMDNEKDPKKKAALKKQLTANGFYELPHETDAKKKKTEATTIRGRQIESAIKKLRESKNPDAVILNDFRNNMTKHSIKEAVLRTAKTFRIDLSDVVDIIKEAKDKKDKKDKKNPFAGKFKPFKPLNVPDKGEKKKVKEAQSPAQKAAFQKMMAAKPKAKTSAIEKDKPETKEADKKVAPKKVEEKKTAPKKKDDPCWKDYEMVGTKKKDGKTVPNCVKK